MKKILLMLVALVATVTLSAKDGEEMEGWQKSFTPVANADDLAGIHTAVAPDGSVYASSTYNQAFQFAGKAVTDPDGLLSSCVVKYDAQGNEQWAVSLLGKCSIDAMAVDADGTLYLTGNYTDAALTLTGTSGTKILSGDALKANAFVAKVSAEGVFTEAISFVPTASVPEGYEDWCELGIYPNKIVIDANKVLVSCMFKGDVAELGWQGSYVDVFMMAYMDNRSAGIFMLDKADLANATSVATIQHTGRIVDQMMEDIQDFPNAIDFVVYKGVPHIAFVGWGNLTLTTPAGSQPFSFEMAGEGKNEHALVLVNATAPTQAKVFHTAPNDYSGAVYSLVDATLVGDECLMAGTYYGNSPFSTSTVVEKNSPFLVSIDMQQCEDQWSLFFTNGREEITKCMVVTGEETKLSTDIATYTFLTNTGNEKRDALINQSFDDASCYNDQYVSTIFTQENSVVVFSPKLKPSGINEAQATKNTVQKYYNLNGIELTAPQHGLNIVKTADGTRKVLK